MKKIFTILMAGLAIHSGLSAQTQSHPRNCGIQKHKAVLKAHNPALAAKLEAQRLSLQGVADSYKQRQLNGGTDKTTTVPAIPVIFHILVDSSQFNEMGGSAGITRRVDSQMAVIERDYNRQNGDSVNIPWGWKHLYASVGIHFGLAHTDPNGNATPGYEIKITSYPFVADSYFGDYLTAKNDTAGLSAWDVTKYLNVWCMYFSDDNTLLGTTTPLSFCGPGGGEPYADEGVCINYLVLGKRSSPSDNYISTGYGTDYYDLGRTLTHELGHFFEIWHTWGDDGGACPWNGGYDDGIADTPPESDAKYGADPDTMTSVGGSYTDACLDSSGIDMQPIGIASHDYMNYTDDIAMQLFTNDQAAVMISQITGSGENTTLTGNPPLLNYPSSVSRLEIDNNVSIFPNPSGGVVNVTIAGKNDALENITVVDLLGRQVAFVKGDNKDYYSIDLSGLSKGIYFVKCNFASGSVTRKILLQ